MKKLFVIVIITALIVVAGLTFFFRTPEEQPVGEHDVFAQCLYQSGMRMYGSVTCSFCARQRRLFGDSFRFIQEIECDPRNPDHESERCIKKDISHTPTWILEDENGDDVYRFEAGIQSLKKLSEVSKCPLS